MELPSAEAVADRRVAKFMERITETIATQDLDAFREIVARYQQLHEADPIDIAAALAHLSHGDKLLRGTGLPAKDGAKDRTRESSLKPPRPSPERDAQPRAKREAPGEQRAERSRPRSRDEDSPAPALERYRVEVGRMHGVQPGNLVGAIANEAGVSSAHIGRIEIFDDHSTIELPVGMPKEIFKLLKKVWVAGRPLDISRLDDAQRDRRGPRKPKRR
jgi:ATP-dependent RNA helicase DeaD